MKKRGLFKRIGIGMSAGILLLGAIPAFAEESSSDLQIFGRGGFKYTRKTPYISI